jgi:hypothetical protein
LNAVLNSSKILVYLSDEGENKSIAEFLYIATANAEDQDVLDELKNLTKESFKVISTGDLYTLSMVRLKIGFPLFFVTETIPFKSQLRGITSNKFNRADFYIDSKYISYQILPLGNILGDENSEGRRLYLLSKVLKLIKYDSSGKYFKYQDKKIADDDDGVINIFINLSGDKFRREINKDVEELLSTAKGKSLLKEYIKNNELDYVEKRILESMIEEEV